MKTKEWTLREIDAIDAYHKPKNPEAKVKLREIEQSLYSLVRLLNLTKDATLQLSQEDYDNLYSLLEASQSPYRDDRTPKERDTKKINLPFGRFNITITGE